ncbi:sensor histidine kinase (plasmid) [Streptomyces sp. BI20]|uniref:sensor histidine kinase n=1 Tax=Streptomyces sp. BI20 TaxID=3403460 RepID=UPI003C70E41D
MEQDGTGPRAAGEGPTAPGPVRPGWGPTGRDRWAAAACLATSTAFEASAAWAHDSWATHPALRWSGIVLGSLALLGRRRRFPLAAGTGLAAALVSMQFTVVYFLAWAAGRYRSRRSALVFGSVTGAALLVLAVTGSGPSFLAAGAPAGVAVTLLALATTLLCGVTARRREEDRARAPREAERLVARAVTAERARLAADFHDLLGHDVALLNLIVESLRVRLGPGPLPEEVTRLLDAAHAQCASATENLRTMTAVLRLRRSEAGDADGDEDEDEDGDGWAGLVGAWVAIRAAGTPVRVGETFASNYRTLPPGERDVARHVLVESVANALRHAPGAPLDLRLDRDGPAWTLEVTNGPPGAGRGRPTPAGGTGLGLEGLRRAVARIGGELTVRTGPDGGHAVRARVPGPAAPGPEPREGASE